jgi:hypothetical protein
LIPLRRSRPNRRECLTLWHERTSRKRSKMEGSVGRVCTYGRELLRGWWGPIGLMANFMTLTASVRNILDRPS